MLLKILIYSFFQIIVDSTEDWQNMSHYFPVRDYERSGVAETVADFYTLNYLNSESHLSMRSLLEVASDVTFNYPSSLESHIYAQNGVPVYSYIFDYMNGELLEAETVPPVTNLKAGASHGSDVLTLFLSSTVTDNAAREINVTWNFADKVISVVLGEITHNFVVSGNPSLQLFRWPIYKANNSEYAIKIGLNGLQEVPYHTERRQFWDRINRQYNLRTL